MRQTVVCLIVLLCLLAGCSTHHSQSHGTIIIENHSGHPIMDAVVMVGDQRMNFGPIPDGELTLGVYEVTDSEYVITLRHPGKEAKTQSVPFATKGVTKANRLIIMKEKIKLLPAMVVIPK